MTPDPAIGEVDRLTADSASAIADTRRKVADWRAVIAAWDLPRWEP